MDTHLPGEPVAQALWEKPVHSVRSSLNSQAFPTPRKHRTSFRFALLHYKPHDPCPASRSFLFCGDAGVG